MPGDAAGQPPTHVALLRGVNVGGRTAVPMARLREVVESLGHTGVETYLRSGNVLFTPGTRSRAPHPLAHELERAVADAFDVPAAVVVLTGPDLLAVYRANPFPDPADPAKLHAVLFADDLPATVTASAERAQQESAAHGSPDEVHVVGRVVYLRTPGGIGRSDLARRLGRAEGPLAARAAGTARNWSTVTALLERCGLAPG